MTEIAAKAVERSPGVTAIVSLAVLTAVEFVVSSADISGSLAMLTVIALVKAAVILSAFMHLRNVLREEG